MRSTPWMVGAAIALAAVGASSAFQPSPMRSIATVLYGKNDDGGKQWAVEETEASPLSKFNIPNPLAELGDMMSNWDDVIDDFFNKRMGNGEVFYGKRKYKPSGKIESEYNGGGFSDWRKIEAAREFREERARLREEAKQREAEKKRV